MTTTLATACRYCGHVMPSAYSTKIHERHLCEKRPVAPDTCTCGHHADLHREAFTATGSGCTHWLCDGCTGFEPDIDRADYLGDDQ